MFEVQNNLIGYGCLNPLIFLELKESSTLNPCCAKKSQNCMENYAKTYLEVDDDQCDYNSGEQVAKVRCVLSVDSLLQAVDLVWLCQQEVEESDDASLEFSSLVSSNGDWGEAFPEDALADVGGNKEGDTRSETVSLLKELVKHEDHESS